MIGLFLAYLFLLLCMMICIVIKVEKEEKLNLSELIEDRTQSYVSLVKCWSPAKKRQHSHPRALVVIYTVSSFGIYEKKILKLVI